jgi:hypothetical protein
VCTVVQNERERASHELTYNTFHAIEWNGNERKRVRYEPHTLPAESGTGMKENEEDLNLTDLFFSVYDN